MTQSEAKEHAAKFAALCAKLDDSLHAFKAAASRSQCREYTRLVGKVMGEVFCCVLDPIWRQYPEIEPPEMRAPPPPDVPMDRALAERVASVLEALEEAIAIWSEEVAMHCSETWIFNPWDEPGLRSSIENMWNFIRKYHPDLLSSRSRTNRPTER